MPNRRQQQLQTAANGRTGDPGGQFTPRGDKHQPLEEMNGGFHLQIYPCFSFKGTWSEPNFQTSIFYDVPCDIFRGEIKTQLQFPDLKCFVDLLCRPRVGLVLISLAFLTRFLVISWYSGGFTCHHLPCIPPARLRTPWLRRTPMRRPKGVKLRVVSPGVQLLQIALHAFFWCSYITCVAAGYFHVLVNNMHAACGQTTLW